MPKPEMCNAQCEEAQESGWLCTAVTTWQYSMPACKCIGILRWGPEGRTCQVRIMHAWAAQPKVATLHLLHSLSGSY